MPHEATGFRSFITKKQVITVDSKDFSGVMVKVRGETLELEYRPVCVREQRPLGEWTTDPDEADRIASDHRRQHRHATTVQIRN